jgi:hypothetical protein
MDSTFSAIHMRSIFLLPVLHFPTVLSGVISSTLGQVKIVSGPSVASTIGSRPPWIYWLPLLVAQFSIIYVVVASGASPPSECLPLFELYFTHWGVSAHRLAPASLSWWSSKSLLDVELLLKLPLLFRFDCHFHVVVIASLWLGNPASSHTSSALRFHVLGFFSSNFFGLVWLRLRLLRFLNWFDWACFLRGFGGLVADVCGVEGFF